LPNALGMARSDFSEYTAVHAVIERPMKIDNAECVTVILVGSGFTFCDMAGFRVRDVNKAPEVSTKTKKASSAP